MTPSDPITNQIVPVTTNESMGKLAQCFDMERLNVSDPMQLALLCFLVIASLTTAYKIEILRSNLQWCYPRRFRFVGSLLAILLPILILVPFFSVEQKDKDRPSTIVLEPVAQFEWTAESDPPAIIEDWAWRIQTQQKNGIGRTQYPDSHLKILVNGIEIDDTRTSKPPVFEAQSIVSFRMDNKEFAKIKLPEIYSKVTKRTTLDSWEPNAELPKYKQSFRRNEYFAYTNHASFVRSETAVKKFTRRFISLVAGKPDQIPKAVAEETPIVFAYSKNEGRQGEIQPLVSARPDNTDIEIISHETSSESFGFDNKMDTSVLHESSLRMVHLREAQKKIASKITIHCPDEAFDRTGYESFRSIAFGSPAWQNIFVPAAFILSITVSVVVIVTAVSPSNYHAESIE